MAKELPYFKFTVSEWINGEIAFEGFQVQGVFINICAHYWFKSGCLNQAEIKRRVKCKQATIDLLIERGYIKMDGSEVRISFLDDQIRDWQEKSGIARHNGKQGGAPKGNKNAQKNKPETTKEQAKTTNIDKRREDKRREESLHTDSTNTFFYKSRFAKIFGLRYLQPAERMDRGDGNDTDLIFELLKGMPPDEVMSRGEAYVEYNRAHKFAIPTKVTTIVDNLKQVDYREKIKAMNPDSNELEQIKSRPKQYDYIGTSEPGSLE